jgi:hypothetical protein
MFLNFRNIDEIPKEEKLEIPIVKVILKKEKFETVKEESSENNPLYKSINFEPKFLSHEKLQEENSFSELEKGEFVKKKITEDSFEIEANKKKFFEKISLNFKNMDNKQKIVFFIILTISSIIYIVASIYIFRNYFFDNLNGIKNTEFFCLGVDVTDRDKFCIIAIGQKAFGFFALGQIATGFIAIGQISIGFFTIGQASFCFIFQFFGQASISAISWYSQIGITLIYSHASMISTSPLRPLLLRDKKPYNICCN